MLQRSRKIPVCRWPGYGWKQCWVKMSCCAFPKDLAQGLEVSLEYEFGDDTSRKSTVQIRNAHLGLAKHGQVALLHLSSFREL